ncbi:hypothetical protein LTR64_004441 [Lithohypha guttulata]|uniref:MFS general substrate transporter n=1 Tax=Lithohypha guttulata TaxID=1690604 RepID=A0AAN7YCH0_9EURO|nr:hypothetical protein LTR51_006263 [Lithohypha guttulata]KAK5088470.1 hypothetical protein LTR05_002688 [Lithohypha guttulata]
MAIYGGSLADLFEREERASVWPFFALSPLLGPTLAPIASGWIAEYFGWRWVEWSTLIISSAIFVLAILFLPETLGPTILSWKARLLREETGNDKYKTERDEQGGPFDLLRSRLLRITSFILTEPTTVLFELYLTLLYVLVYGFLEGFQYIFTDTYDFSTGERYSSFAAIAIGILVAIPYILLIYHFASVRSKRNSTTISPEGRLLPSLFTSPLLPIALFWMGFTNRLDISYWSNLSACFVLGFALMALFTSAYHYLLDAYGTNSSSALGAVTFVRYAVSGGVVIATNPLYEALTVRWMLTLLGGIAVLLAPVPWAFWRYGSKIREKSKWAES